MSVSVSPRLGVYVTLFARAGRQELTGLVVASCNCRTDSVWFQNVGRDGSVAFKYKRKLTILAHA